jgi:hypothetical protein
LRGEIVPDRYSPDKVLDPSRGNEFIATELFLDGARSLFRYATAACEKLLYPGHAAAILDGRKPHSSNDLLDEFGHYRVETFFLPARSSRQTQPLDLGIFNLENTEAEKTKSMKGLNRQM